ncbi:MAG: hypothetical protein E7138_01615 [Rikenellaceae bacterium]|nr:hypothetical protein [Rikenellaceae bacterium]
MSFRDKYSTFEKHSTSRRKKVVNLQNFRIFTPLK